MLGLIQIDDRVTWTDMEGAVRKGVVVALTDDALWAEVRELDQDDVVQMPASLLHPID